MEGDFWGGLGWVVRGGGGRGRWGVFIVFGRGVSGEVVVDDD